MRANQHQHAPLLLMLLLLVKFDQSLVVGFTVNPVSHHASTKGHHLVVATKIEHQRVRVPSHLQMGKGFNSARNKQAELAKRMEAAKRQKNPDFYDSNEEPEEIKVSADEQLQKDREEFAQLLSTSHLPKPEKKSVAMRSTLDQAAKDRAPTLSKSKGPKVNAKKLKKKKMKQAGGGSNGEEAEDVPLQQGDVARRRDFEHLVSTETSLQLGAIRAAQLVPWVPPYLSNYLVVVADPRSQSGDLHQTVQYLTSNLEPEMLAQVMVVTADSAAETVR